MNFTSISFTTEIPYYFSVVHKDEALMYASGEGVTIAIIDSGFDLDHPDYYKNIWINSKEIPNNGIDDDSNGLIDDVRGWDFAYGDNNVDSQINQEITSHGTNMAGILARYSPNVTIMTIRFIDSSGSFLPSETETKLPNCINYAVKNGANVILLALGQKDPMSTNTANAIINAYENNITIVSSAGNSNSNSIFYPSYYSNVISVGSVDATYSRSIWDSTHGSNYGPQIDFVAPGTRIKTSDLQGSETDVDGTSASTAIVSSLVSLIYELNPDVTPFNIRSLLKNTSKDIGDLGFDNYFGYGLVDFLKSVQFIFDKNAPSISEYAVTVIKETNYTGKLSFKMVVIEETVLSECKIHYKLSSLEDWKENIFCNSLTFSHNSQQTLTFNLSISGSFISYYIEFYDIIGHELEIGNFQNPLIIPTGLIEYTTSGIYSSSIPLISSAINSSDGLSSSRNTPSSSIGEWFTRQKTANFSYLSIFSLIFLIIISKRIISKRH
jgi:hypothetical protein